MLKPSEIEARVRELLKKHGVTKPPIDAEKIARKEGVEVRYEPFEGDDVSGALYRNAETTVIGVNELHWDVRQRFTIAHEVGHLLLHAGTHVDSRRSVNLTADPSGLKPMLQFLRDKVSKEAKDYREIEANRFAASLLMPLDFLASDLGGSKIPMPVPLEAVETLRRRYKVSQEAMLYRLINLGVPTEIVPETDHAKR